MNIKNEVDEAWKDFDCSYRTSILWMDAQHGVLLNLFRKMASDLNHNYSDRLFEIVSKCLEDYIVKHFKEEEEYFYLLTKDEKEEHQLQHTIFINMVNEHINLPVHERRAGMVKFMTFCETWFLNHILKLDQDLSKKIMKNMSVK